MQRKILFKSLLMLVLISMAFVPCAQASEAQPIFIENINEDTITVNVETISDNNTAYYIVYNTDDLSEISKIQSDNSNTINLEMDNGTTFKVKSYSSDDKEIASSENLTVYTQSVTLEAVTLSNDMYVKELALTNSEIDLNYHTLHVFENAVINSNFNANYGELSVEGNLIHSNGTLTIGGGTVNVLGDYKIVSYKDGGTSYGKLKMMNSDDRLNVDGDFVTDSIHAHTGYLIEGVFRLKGDFSQINSTGDFLMSRHNFDTDENFKIIFCGDDTQTVYFYDPKRSQFSIWEIENESEKPMEITNGFGIRTLKQDSVIPCDVEVWSYLYTDRQAPPIDLNGYTLRIEGDLINNRVNMLINKGKLIVEGDYKIQITKLSGEYAGKLRWSYGTLRMLYDEDYVLVMGDFIQDSYYSHSKCLIAGTLEIKGDFKQITTKHGQDTYYNFDASGTHKVILSGDGVQIVDFEDPETNQFNILEIPADDKPGHIIVFTSEWSANEIVNSSTMTALLNWAE